MSSPVRCLVTGASGYIGGRLVPELLSAGYTVRCMPRDAGKLSDRPWSADVEIAVADAVDESAVRHALEGVDVAYYLIHSLGTDASFERRDRAATGIFAAAAKAAGVQRIVLVTGGNSGIGLGIARAGASVAVWARRHERNLAAVAELERLGTTAIGVQCDVSDEDNVAAAMRETLDRFGRLDCLVDGREPEQHARIVGHAETVGEPFEDVETCDLSSAATCLPAPWARAAFVGHPAATRNQSRVRPARCRTRLTV